MYQRIVSVVLTMLLCSCALVSLSVGASTSNDSEALSLIPRPKEVTLREGGFHVGQRTKIVVQLGHQAEDRIAAETLAEEVQDQSGLRLNIIGAKPSIRAEDGVIMLVRLQDSHVRHFLARQGLRADALVGQDGYLLFSDNSHLIVAANSGEGLFSGVQTLRQLIRPDGNTVIFPAVAIRDWPNLQDRSVQEGISRDTPPMLSQQFRRGPRS
jgi:hexosaminidase